MIIKLPLIFILTLVLLFSDFSIYVYYLTVTYLVLVLFPAEFIAVKITVYVPAFVYLCTGFLFVEYVLSPKLHFHDVGEPVLLSVNVTFRGSYPEVGDAEKAAVRGGFELRVPM